MASAQANPDALSEVKEDIMQRSSSKYLSFREQRSSNVGSRRLSLGFSTSSWFPSSYSNKQSIADDLGRSGSGVSDNDSGGERFSDSGGSLCSGSESMSHSGSSGMSVVLALLAADSAGEEENNHSEKSQGDRINLSSDINEEMKGICSSDAVKRLLVQTDEEECSLTETDDPFSASSLLLGNNSPTLSQLSTPSISSFGDSVAIGADFEIKREQLLYRESSEESVFAPSVESNGSDSHNVNEIVPHTKRSRSPPSSCSSSPLKLHPKQQCIEDEKSDSICYNDSPSYSMETWLKEPLIIRESFYTKFANKMASYIDSHDLGGMTKVLIEPFFEPDMQLLTKYWSRSRTLTSKEQQGISASSHGQVPASQHPYGLRDLVKNGSFQALKLFAFHFHLIPDGMFRLYESKVIPTINSTPGNGGNTSGFRVISSFRYSGTLVAPLPLPSCDEVKDYEDMKRYLLGATADGVSPSSLALLNQFFAGSNNTSYIENKDRPEFDWERNVVETRYSSLDNRHHRDQVLKNIIGDDPEEAADVMRRLGGIFNADHWLKHASTFSDQKKQSLHMESNPESPTVKVEHEDKLRFLSREEMMATISMMRQTASVPQVIKRASATDEVTSIPSSSEISSPLSSETKSLYERVISQRKLDEASGTAKAGKTSSQFDWILL